MNLGTKTLICSVNLAIAAGVLGPPAMVVSTGCSSDQACGCDNIRLASGSVVNEAHQPLECTCAGSSETCPKTSAAYEAELCARVDAGTMGASVVRRTGCGAVTIGPSADLSGRMATFDAQSGALVGILEFSDINYGACNAHTYIFGRTMNDCDELEVCTLCGVGTDPPCP
jgi:hypothetical protein